MAGYRLSCNEQCHRPPQRVVCRLMRVSAYFLNGVKSFLSLIRPYIQIKPIVPIDGSCSLIPHRSQYPLAMMAMKMATSLLFVLVATQSWCALACPRHDVCTCLYKHAYTCISMQISPILVSCMCFAANELQHDPMP